MTDLAPTDKILNAAEAILKANPGGDVNPIALAELQAQMDALPTREDGIPSAKAEILSLAAKLYSERGWLEYGSPEGLNALIALHLQGLRRSLRR